MNMCDRLTNVVAAQLATCESDTLIAREQERIREKPFARRCALQAIQSMVVAHPEAARAFFFHRYEKAGLTPIGTGFNSTVVSDGSEIIKIERKSARMSKRERDIRLGELAHLIAVNTDAHGETTTETVIGIGDDPADKARRVIILRQPIVERDDYSPQDAAQQYAAFAKKSLDDMHPSGVLPDVYGTNNLFFSDGKLRLVDTVAIPASDRGFHLQTEILDHWNHMTDDIPQVATAE